MTINIDILEACEQGNLPQIKNLVSSGWADMSDLKIGLILARKNNHKVCIKYLIKKTKNGKSNPDLLLIKGIVRNNLICVQYLISRYTTHRYDFNKMLLKATSFGRYEILDYLLKLHRHQQDILDDCVIKACTHPNQEIMERLVSSGADITINNPQAYITACEGGNSETVSYILQNTGNQFKNYTPSAIAAGSSGDLDTVNTILTYSDDDEDMSLAVLAAACKHGYSEIVIYVLTSGLVVELDIQNKLIMSALSNNHLDVIEILISYFPTLTIPLTRVDQIKSIITLLHNGQNPLVQELCNNKVTNIPYATLVELAKLPGFDAL